MNNMSYQLKSPVVLFIYMRSKNILVIISRLRQVRPVKIYIVADGPKNQSEEAVCSKTRKLVESHIDWPCKISKVYANQNLGLKRRFESGLNFVYTNEEQAIILEDDCIPDPTFFRFCDEMLEKYKEDNRIMTISGNNFQGGKNKYHVSYYFSRYPHVWGWATWKRAWKLYDSNIPDWPKRRNTEWLKVLLGGLIISEFWKYIFDRLYSGKINTWDYQLTYASFKHNGLNIIPAVNLVTNLGYGSDSTNIKKYNKTIGIPTCAMQFPLVHPNRVETNESADSRIDNLVYLHPLGKLSLVVKYMLGII